MFVRFFVATVFLHECLSAIALAQQPESPTVEAVQKTSGLLANWYGNWEGTVINFKGPGGTGQKRFSMQLTIKPTEIQNTFEWRMVYDGASGRSDRNYLLICKDPARGHFVIDEQNGIELDAVLLGDTLSTQFVVGGQRIWTTYRFVSSAASPEIHFELFSSNVSETTRTAAKGDIPDVESVRANNRQFGVLKPSKQEAGETLNSAVALPAWKKLETEAYRGKQDDIYFVDENLGWYVNGAGRIFNTIDGGASWKMQLSKPGTFFRCVAFVDEKHGFAGNIGPGYFPNVSDTIPLYETKNGGETWAPASSIEGPDVVGLCSIQVLKEPFINAGTLDSRVRLIGVGRVGGPTAMIVSDDLGLSWQQIDISAHAAMAFDVHFMNRNEGFIAAASDADVSKSNALILSTKDGGKTWTKAWQSSRPYELTWKMSFPSPNVGYVTIQSYNPDPSVKERFVAKTMDGGKTWTEVALVSDAKVREFGIAFLDEKTGWVGATPNGFQTTDGGATWSAIDMGNAVNKIRLLKTDKGHVGYAIGVNVYRLDLPH